MKVQERAVIPAYTMIHTYIQVIDDSTNNKMDDPIRMNKKSTTTTITITRGDRGNYD